MCFTWSKQLIALAETPVGSKVRIVETKAVKSLLSGSVSGSLILVRVEKLDLNVRKVGSFINQTI